MPRVILRRCDEYSPDRIRGLVVEAMDDLGLKPRGRTMVKPNCVIAHQLLFPHAFTRPEFLDGLLAALRERGDDISELSVGERSGITVPTRYCFAEAGYFPVLRKHRVRAHLFDETPQVRHSLSHAGRLRDFIYIPEPVATNEWLVSAPKFKAHPWTKVTFNLKLWIGMQDDAHRLIDHDHHLHTKIADLFEVIRPQLCVIDGVIAGAKTMLTPRPFPLGLIVVGDDPVATDVVCTHIAGLDPHDVDHIRIVAERGWGSLDLADVDIEGDVGLEQAQDRAAGFELSLDKIDRTYNNRSNLKIHVGPPPDTYDYCWGGCPGALDEAMGVIERLQPEVRDEIKPMHFVYGAYRGDIEPAPGERVIFMGDCAQWRGQVLGQEVEIPSLYQARELKNPERARASDLVGKMLAFWWNRLRSGRNPVLRVKGCTVSVAESVLYLSTFGHTRNPYFHPRIVFRFAWNYLVAKLMRLKVQLFARRRPPP